MYIGIKLTPNVDKRGKVHVRKRCIMVCECGCEQTYYVFPSKRHSRYVSHSHEAKARFAGKTLDVLYGPERADMIRQKRSESLGGVNHYLHGKTFDEFHGAEAERLHREYSARLSGKGNPRYGKPPSERCARGISGTYKGTMFRSSYELAFLLHADESGWFHELIPEPFTIPYSVGQKQRTYWPDYLRTGTRTLYEIKPRKHIAANVNNFNEKCAAAIQFAAVNDYGYEVIDEALIDSILPYKQRSRACISRLPGVILSQDLTTATRTPM